MGEVREISTAKGEILQGKKLDAMLRGKKSGNKNLNEVLATTFSWGKLYKFALSLESGALIEGFPKLKLQKLEIFSKLENEEMS